MGMTQECDVSLIHTEIRPHAELIAISWACRDAAQGSEIGCQQLSANDAPLLIALVRGEVEYAVFPNRAAECETELPALKKRIRIETVARQPRVRGKMMVAKEHEGGTMDVVCA